MNTRSSTQRAPLARTAPPPLLPTGQLPEVAFAKPQAASAAQAIIAVLPVDAAAKVLTALPDSARWTQLHGRAQPKPGTLRTTTLNDRQQTLAVLGYIAGDASAFERLSLAGRLVKETAAREPQTLALFAPRSPGKDGSSQDALLAAALAHSFRLPAFRSTPRESRALRRIMLLGAPPGARLDVNFELAAARGNNLVRWLTAMPPNLLDSRNYRQALQQLARRHRLQMKWFDQASLRRAGAGAFLAVAAGNAGADAGIAKLSYRPRSHAGGPDIALVGKGILFDTGGVNLKPHRSMLEMHTDMSGSAVAVATLLALAELRAPIAVDAWLAITENQIGPHAYRPQEIVRAANGITIQVVHTDAEGRMVLADTLALASRTRPKFMLDFATLTGAAVNALTERMSAVLTNRPQLVTALVAAGRTSGERVWPFPLEADYDAELESKVADVLQCAVDGKGDHILASRFLARFVGEGIPWAHVDLASATRSGGLAHINTDVTGFGVRFALELVLKHDILGAARRCT